VHSTQNVDKIVKSSVRKTRKTGDTAKTEATAKVEKLAHNKGHLNCQLWWLFAGFSIFIPQKKHFCINSNFSGDGSRKYALNFSQQPATFAKFI